MVSITATLLSAALWFWGTGLYPVWWMAWLAPLPILLIATRTSGWRAFGFAAASVILGSINMWHYLHVVQLPLAVVASASVLPALFYGLGVVLFRRFAVRGALWRAALLFPAFWVTCEYINNVTSPHGTFGNLGYTQMDFLPILQIASVTGIWGIEFSMFLFAAALALKLSSTGTPELRQRVSITMGIVLVVVLGFGYWRLHATPAYQQRVKVALMGTGKGTTFPHDDAAALALLRDYSAKASDVGKLNAHIILLPEKIAVVSDDGTMDVDALYEKTSSQTGAHVVVGIDRGTGSKRWNEARMYSPQGSLEATYDKHHMIPHLEDVDQMGTKLTTLDEPSGKWGVQICKDMDFPALSRQYGQQGVGLLLVPAWDFMIDGWLHGRMAIMRGVESGFTIVRAAKQGLLTVSDDRGRVLAEQNDANTHLASLVTTAPVWHDETLYARWGDWFAWLNVAVFVGMMLMPIRKVAPSAG